MDFWCLNKFEMFSNSDWASEAQFRDAVLSHLRASLWLRFRSSTSDYDEPTE